MNNLFNLKIADTGNITGDTYLDTKALYVQHFNSLPDINYRNNIDGEKLFTAIRENFGQMIISVHQYKWYQDSKKKYHFDKTIILFKNHCMVEMDVGYIEFFHDGKQKHFIAAVTALADRFKERKKKEPREINLVMQTAGGLG